MTFLVRAGQFMSMPFLAIYLTHEKLFTPSQIGFVLGISGFFLSVTGLINGIYIDRNSHRNTLIYSLFLAGFCYFGFAFSMHLFYSLLFLNAALGWFRSLTEISTVSMLAHYTKSENLAYAHSARFVGANLGVALGPLIGAAMAAQHSLLIFFIAGAIHIVLGVFMLFSREKTKYIKANQHAFSRNFQEVFKDKILIKITIINLILWIVYAQLDTTIPQYLASTSTGKNSAILFSVMMMINALICVICQPFILRWAERTSLKISAVLGSIMFVVAFFLIGIYPTSVVMIISVIIMSLAELLTLPINGLLILRMAPKHLLASYNGLANVGLLGLSIGPVIGGYGLRFIEGSYTFLISAILPIIAACLYLKCSLVYKNIPNMGLPVDPLMIIDGYDK
jgi:MFS family permease